MEAQSVALSVYTQEGTLTGTISIPKGLRLSDLLNDRHKTMTVFLTLADVTINHIDGTKETSKTVHINKNSIHMITTLASDSRGIGAQSGPKQYPFSQKRPVRTKIRLPGYELYGCLFCAQNQGIADLLTEERSFIPCTDTMIYDVERDSRWKTDFATINRNHISRFDEDGLYS